MTPTTHPAIDARLRDPASTLRTLPRTVTFDRIEFREAAGGGLTFEGHAAVFNETSEVLYDMWGPFREVMKPGCFADVIAANEEGREDTKFLGLNHERNLPLARFGNGTLKLEEDDTGLLTRAELAPTSAAKDLAVLLERKDVHQMSFTFTVTKDGEKWSWDSDGDIREVHTVQRLYDVSPVVYPAYPQTDAGLRALAEMRALAIEIDAGQRSADPAQLAGLGRVLALLDDLPDGVAERARQSLDGRQQPEPEPRAETDESGADGDGEPDVRDEIAAAARRRHLQLRERALSV